MKIGKFDVVEEARKVWNCKRFNRRNRKCDGVSLCTGVYDCRLFELRKDVEDAHKKWINFCLEVHRDC